MSRLQIHRWELLLTVAGDVMVVHLSYFASFALRYGGHPPTAGLQAYTESIAFLSALLPLAFYLCDLYSPRSRGWASEVERVGRGLALSLLLSVFMAFWFRLFAFPRTIFVLAFLIQYVLFVLWRGLIWGKGEWRHPSRLAVVGSAEAIAAILAGREASGELRTAAYIVAATSGSPSVSGLPGLDSYPCLGHASDAQGILDAIPPYDGVILSSDLPPELKYQLALGALAEGLQVCLEPCLYDTLLSTGRFSCANDTPVLELGCTDGLAVAMELKRATDVVIAATALVVCIPAFAAIAALIAITSPGGPVLFRQERVGMGGRTFLMLKFRTMKPDAETRCGPILASTDDPRVTPVGSFLRRTRLDELPQFLNVLRGDMSLVGPRPERPHFVRSFLRRSPEYALRHRVPVGLTGLAQTMGTYGTDYRAKLTYDMAYAWSWSMARDLAIMARTPGVMFTREKPH